MAQVKLRDKGQLTIPVEILQEWHKTNQVSTHDLMEAQLANGILMIIPHKKMGAGRDIMSYAGAGKGLWGNTAEAIDQSIQSLRHSWTR